MGAQASQFSETFQCTYTPAQLFYSLLVLLVGDFHLPTRTYRFVRNAKLSSQGSQGAAIRANCPCFVLCQFARSWGMVRVAPRFPGFATGRRAGDNDGACWQNAIVRPIPVASANEGKNSTFRAGRPQPVFFVVRVYLGKVEEGCGITL
jgi:hypothetical protein